MKNLENRNDWMDFFSLTYAQEDPFGSNMSLTRAPWLAVAKIMVGTNVIAAILEYEFSQLKDH